MATEASASIEAARDRRLPLGSNASACLRLSACNGPGDDLGFP